MSDEDAAAAAVAASAVQISREAAAAAAGDQRMAAAAAADAGNVRYVDEEDAAGLRRERNVDNVDVILDELLGCNFNGKNSLRCKTTSYTVLHVGELYYDN